MNTNLFYKPEGAWAADVIPLFHGGTFHLFYLLDWRDIPRRGEGTPWYRISTTDLVHFNEHGEMLERGAEIEQDLYVFTGSAIRAEGQFHIFYTGHNPHLRQQGHPEQGVMHAASDDLQHWCKLEEPVYFAPAPVYEPHDWRDPFVFWNEEASEYWMLKAARLAGGPSRRRGCTALSASKDLVHWEVREPFYAPGLYYTHECPDLFHWGEWWYLLFSEFSEGCLTRYRMCRSLAGPWLTPPDDAFDGRAFYAAKTASDGKNRYIFGWNPTRVGETSSGAWEWGGSIAIHQLVQRPDGTLGAKLPDLISGAFTKTVKPDCSAGLGEAAITPQGIRLSGEGFSACACGEMPGGAALYEMEISFEDGTRGVGMLLRGSHDFESGCYLRLEPGRGRLVFDTWPRAGDLPHQPGLERPVQLIPGETYRLRVVVEDTVCEAYLNDEIALSARLYEHPAGLWGAFCQQGSAHFGHACAKLLE